MLSWFLHQTGVESAFLERPDQVTFACQEMRYLYFGFPIVLLLGVGISIDE